MALRLVEYNPTKVTFPLRIIGGTDNFKKKKKSKQKQNGGIDASCHSSASITKGCKSSEWNFITPHKFKHRLEILRENQKKKRMKPKDEVNVPETT